MRSALLTLSLLAASLTHGQERTLAWRSLDVTAKLENDGTLKVSERQRMLFNGDWNGGERVFRVEPGQQLTLLGMNRVEGGQSRAMAEARGDGVGLHEYRFDGTTLRWRAREASAPPFRNAERVYVVDYQLRNVIERKGDVYVLDHDFAFPDRTAPIEALSVKLELDPSWQAPAGFAPLFERTNVPPGEGATLNVQLQWTGAGEPQFLALPPPTAPAQVAHPAPRPGPPPSPPPPPASMTIKLLAFGGFAVAATLMTVLFLRREESLGRFEPRPEVTPQWLEENVLGIRAEVVGAAWDGETGPGEVAALIAIMTAEGKIENVAGAPKLRLLVPRDTLSEYERGFVDALFIQGNEIDPAALQKHYRETGFRPATAIAKPLEAAAQRLVGSTSRSIWGVGCVAILFSVFVFPLMAIAFTIALAMGGSYRRHLRGRMLATLIPVPFLLPALLHTYKNSSLAWLIATLLAGIVLLGIALRLSSWRGSSLELRNLLAFHVARAFFLQRIVRRDPEVDPRWIPYMLALGLVPDDRWSVVAEQRYVPTHDTFNDRRHTPSSPARPAAEPTPRFQAGGGNFGGAGATGNWASIQTFAATVAAKPARSASSGSISSSSGSGWSWSSSGSSSSSSRSSSSSSSSSSRSGGGGGGGW